MSDTDGWQGNLQLRPRVIHCLVTSSCFRAWSICSGCSNVAMPIKIFYRSCSMMATIIRHSCHDSGRGEAKALTGPRFGGTKAALQCTNNTLATKGLDGSASLLTVDKACRWFQSKVSRTSLVYTTCHAVAYSISSLMPIKRFGLNCY